MAEIWHGCSKLLARSLARLLACLLSCKEKKARKKTSFLWLFSHRRQPPSYYISILWNTNPSDPPSLPSYRQANILSSTSSLTSFSPSSPFDVVAKDAVDKMIRRNPQQRISASSLMQHPVFWDAEMQLKFFRFRWTTVGALFSDD